MKVVREDMFRKENGDRKKVICCLLYFLSGYFSPVYLIGYNDNLVPIADFKRKRTYVFALS